MTDITGDSFSDDEVYRYALWKWWDDPQSSKCRRRLCMLMLNPSKGNRHKFDPTNTRCEVRGRQLGFGGIIFANVFPIVATDPKDMMAAENPLGSRAMANEAIRVAVDYDAYVIAGWGVHGTHLGRDEEVKTLLVNLGVTVHALKLTKEGHPGHPLYLPYALKPFVWFG